MLGFFHGIQRFRFRHYIPPSPHKDGTNMSVGVQTIKFLKSMLRRKHVTYLQPVFSCELWPSPFSSLDSLQVENVSATVTEAHRQGSMHEHWLLACLS